MSRRFWTQLSLITLACLSGLLTVEQASACKCAPQTVQEALAQADVIFEGRVRQIQPSEDQRSLQVSLAVVRSWKALEDVESVTVATSASSASCGFSFEQDRSYLVYARRAKDDGALQVSLCSRTRGMSQAAEDLAALGAGVTPVAVAAAPDAGQPAEEPPATAGGGCASTRTDASGAALLLGPALMGRRRRRSLSH